MKIVISAASQIEGVLKKEMQSLGLEPSGFINGHSEIDGDVQTLADLNVKLRTAERVYILLGKFVAKTFDQLFDEIAKLPLGDIIPKNAKIKVSARCAKSTLMAFSACQSVAHKAVATALMKKYKINHLPSNGNDYELTLSLYEDVATLLLNASGEGLFKRGYRDLSTEAPIKETLASALVSLSGKQDKPFYDCFCGSGTLPIEAAMQMLNVAPGQNRDFAFEKFGDDYKKAADLARETARANQKSDCPPVFASDINGKMISIVHHHATRAGVEKHIKVFEGDATKVSAPESHGTIVTNPPYGERLLSAREVETLYRDFGKNIRANFRTWGVNVVTSYGNFERCYGKTADKNRKIYNAGLQSRFYSYFSLEKYVPSED